MKSINTLISDIYSLVGGPDGITNYPPDTAANIAGAIERSLGPQGPRTLRLSQMGDRCPCALWSSIHQPELEEQIPPYARIKYCYGHIIEHMIIGLAKAAGHTVEGEQDEISVDGIRGHRDCIVDGCVLDVKSAASRSFLKFKNKTIAGDDPFGYLDQLDGYVLGSIDDPRVITKDRGYLLAVDKQLGHLALYEHIIRPIHITERIRRFKNIVAGQIRPPCTCGTRPYGQSGNVELDLKASYNTFKHACFPNLRTFLYSGGPVYFSKIVREPKDVPEITRDGRLKCTTSNGGLKSLDQSSISMTMQ